MAYQRAIGKKKHIFPGERHHDAARLRQRALHHHAGLRHRGGVVFLPDESIIMVKTQGENWENMMNFGILWWIMMVNYDGELWWTSIMIMINYDELWWIIVFSFGSTQFETLQLCKSARVWQKHNTIGCITIFPPHQPSFSAIINWSFLSQRFLNVFD